MEFLKLFRLVNIGRILVIRWVGTPTSASRQRRGGRAEVCSEESASFSLRTSARAPRLCREALLCISIILIAVLVPYPKKAHAIKKTSLRSDIQLDQTALRRNEAATARIKEIDQKGRDSRYLLMRAAIFDPLAGEPSSVLLGGDRLETTSLKAATARLTGAQSAKTEGAGASGYFIVQYRGPIQPSSISGLRAQGIEIAGYLPNNAYIVRTTAAEAQQLKNTGTFRWVGAYGAGLKVSPELVRTVSASPEIVYLSLLGFRGEDAGRMRAAIEGLPLAAPPIVEQRGDARVWATLSVSRDSLASTVAALANLEGVEWIEERRPHYLQDDNGVRAVQTGYVGGDTPLYRQGLTGAGQIYGTADSGLDTDHSQFRLDSSSAAQTLSFATSTATLTNGLLPFRITNQNNKVLVYYLLGSSSFQEQKDNPNGGQTLNPALQTGTRYLNAVAYDDSGFEYHGTLTTSVAVGRNYGANGSGAVPGIATRSTGDGVAPDAKIVFQDVGHTSGQLPGVDLVSQAMIHEQAYSSGVRVHNNSYGPAPPAIYDQDAADVDDIMWRYRDYTIFFSAGNNSPGDYQVTNAAKNNIVVGASDSPTGDGSLENLARYSNHGPTFDGRIKPDITAPGSVIGATEDADSANSSSYTNSTSATAKDAAVNPDDPNNEGDLVEEVRSGTSYASAMAAGSALLVRQYFVDGFYPSGTRAAGNSFLPSNALVKAVMLNSGRNMAGRFTASNFPVSASGALPNTGQGWGRIALDDALYFAGDRRELRVIADIYNGATAADAGRNAPNPAISTGQVHSYQVLNVSNVEPLRITLAWSDPRAAVGSVVALVNDLNLEVTDPQGTVFRGNVNFSGAWSQAAGAANADNRNPVEAVYIQTPIPGTYSVRVIGANVPGNGQAQITAQPGGQLIDSNRQGYALIATGNFTAGAQPVLNLASALVNGGVNADPFISKNETVTANVLIRNPSALTANNVSLRVEVDPDSQVPANLISINSQPGGQAATTAIGTISPGQSSQTPVLLGLIDDGVDRVGQTIRFKVTMTPEGGTPFITQFTALAQLKLVSFRTRFEPAADPGDPGVIVIPESDWRKRTDDAARPDEDDFFDGDWKLTAAQKADGGGSTASLSDPSDVGRGYGVGETSRNDGQVYDDTRWWTPKIMLPGYRLTESTGLVGNPTDAAIFKAEIDSIDVDVKADFTGDIKQSASSGDFFILRARIYNNKVSVRSTDDSGLTEDSLTNLLYLDSQNVGGSGFIHYSGNNFASGDGRFHIDEDDENLSDVFFRLEMQFRRNGYPQSGEGLFVDNLVVRLRMADTAVYTGATAGTVASVDAASFSRSVAPGQIVAAFGTGFPVGTVISSAAAATPLPLSLEQVSVRVNTIYVPLFYAGATANGGFQVNYQMPFETPPGTAQVEVLWGGRLIASEYLMVSESAPAAFTFSQSGTGQAVALNQDFSINGSAASSPAGKPEARGRFVIVYGCGQGRQLIDSATGQFLTLLSGYPAPASGVPLYTTSAVPTVTIGGVQAQVGFSGLAPGFVGLWQLNVRIPDNAPTGAAVPLVITYGNRTSRSTTIAVN